ncbi:3-hydroxyacyl-CoA dehydrogenase [Pseudomaricurvus alkylphenolicus]|uniref:3-hydroxyacyl-CoA dehydrogenase NAD-binding domain-containing protein n=1 Tax=Pseudomaricurvus alkylphenolicus TaxID=1306991 RepID=UPI00141E424F|nr:3-hydroxyacyl-CoA dehydrogenase NAD-binding domain-containing protein [Pseudomaricurvus alkylphenolicus]NIB40505.1 3-hydroxyacyl-CoA dehydrogenase [Pseudomaricurvus alkylphenolicus]
MSVFNYQKDVDGIVVITMDMTGPVNAMNDEYRDAMAGVVERLESEENLTGVVFASAKKTFFAGGDLNSLLEAQPGQEQAFFQTTESVKSQLRRLEKLPVPVVAAINGAALGGGYEICLACNHRIAYNHNSVQLGLPEVSLGLLPGGGGIVRLVNLLGLEVALPYLLEGKKVNAEAALKAGLIHQLVDDLQDLLPQAKHHILRNKNNQLAAIQPWDIKGFKIPGGNANHPKVAQLISVAPAGVTSKTRGLLPAPEAILDCAVEATRVDPDTALRIESRAMTRLVMTPEAKNMITSFFFQMNQVNGGSSRPKDIPPSQVRKLGILGAGMMGQGIAYCAAMAGIEVVLKDISLDAAEKGKAYSDKLLSKRVRRGRLDDARKNKILELITPSANDEDLRGCDLIIEAVFEVMNLKHKITKQTEPFLADKGIWGTNTSSLPITQLAEVSQRPENFIGIHFFSPVDKMPLIELICGKETSDETLARAFDFARQIGKTPIVVNDSLQFYTSRVFSTSVDEGIRMLEEGLHPTRIDNLGKATGFPVGPITMSDEISHQLTYKMLCDWKEIGVFGKWGEQDQLFDVMATMVDKFDRKGRHHGGGFYDYNEDGSKSLSQEVLETWYKPEVDIPEQDIKDRLLFRPVIESLKCLESSVLRSVADGNIGSLLGIGAPTWTGGYLQFVNTYGLQRFIDRCSELQARYGERFRAPLIVSATLAEGREFN